jgi:hypothetical protein
MRDTTGEGPTKTRDAQHREAVILRLRRGQQTSVAVGTLAALASMLAASAGWNGLSLALAGLFVLALALVIWLGWRAWRLGG